MISFNSKVCGSGLVWPAVLSASFLAPRHPPAATLVVGIVVAVVVAGVVIVVVVVVVVAVGLLQSVAVHVSTADPALLLRGGGYRSVIPALPTDAARTRTRLLGVFEEIRGVLWSKKSGVSVCVLNRIVGVLSMEGDPNQ